MWYQNGIIIWDSVQQNRVYDFITIKIIIMTVNISLQPYNAFLLNLVHVFTHHVPLFKLILVSSSFFINVNCVHKAHMLHIHLLQSVILSFDFRIFHPVLYRIELSTLHSSMTLLCIASHLLIHCMQIYTFT